MDGMKIGHAKSCYDLIRKRVPGCIATGVWFMISYLWRWKLESVSALKHLLSL